MYELVSGTLFIKRHKILLDYLNETKRRNFE